MIGKYLAAAKGSRNVAASGAVSTRGLRSGSSSGMRATVSGRAPVAQSGRPKGNMAGYEGGRAAVIQPNNSGYGNVRPKAGPSEIPVSPVAAAPGGYRKTYNNASHKASMSQCNPFRGDTQLSKMIR